MKSVCVDLCTFDNTPFHLWHCAFHVSVRPCLLLPAHGSAIVKCQKPSAAILCAIVVMAALLSEQQLAAARSVGAYPYLVMMGDAVPPKLAGGKVFVLQFDAKGEPLGRYVTPPYELIYWQSNAVHRWMVRELANGGHNVIYSSEPFDGWVVDARGQPKHHLLPRLPSKGLAGGSSHSSPSDAQG